MINTTETTPHPHAPVAVRRRPPRWLVAAAAVAVLLVGAGFFAFGWPGHGSQPGAAEQTVTRLTALGGMRKCPAPTVERLATATVAFQGTVQGIADGIVTFAPSRFDAGPRTDVVEVRQTDGATEQLMGASSGFEVGQTYLVAAANGDLLGCGYTGTVTPQLRALYDAAF